MAPKRSHLLRFLGCVVLLTIWPTSSPAVDGEVPSTPDPWRKSEDERDRLIPGIEAKGMPPDLRCDDDGGRTWPEKMRAAPEFCWDGLRDFAVASWHDQLEFYSAENLGLLALGVAVAAPLANTTADREIRDWYQQRIRSPDLDRWSAWCKVPGEHLYTIPIYVGAACVGKMFEDTAPGSFMQAWGSRTARAALVGAPAVGVLQIGLGASRPDEGNSHWHPFQDSNGVAGHGFIGALPFLSAASLVENPWLRCPLVAASFASDWSRINDDSHYFSQALLGWWIAYLSVRSVEASDLARQPVLLLPGGPDGSTGVSVLLRY